MLDLSSNEMKTLFPESSSKHVEQGALSSILSLNLSDNPFDNVQEVIEHVQILMPNLTDLQISLFDEADVDFITAVNDILEYSLLKNLL